MFCLDPTTLDALTREALATRIKSASQTSPMRIWIPACATGEEAYSIAICLLDQFEAAGTPPCLQIFATDTDEQALEITRRGIYPKAVAQTLSAGRFTKFFEQHTPETYRVHTRVRERVLVAIQEVLRDPPLFLNLDLISCHNLPSDLEPEVRKRLMTRFHLALKERGWLLLEDANTVGPAASFERASPEWPLYRKCATERVTPFAPEPTPPPPRPVDPSVAQEAALHSADLRPIMRFLHRKRHLEAQVRSAHLSIESMATERNGATSELNARSIELRALTQELGVLQDELHLKVQALNVANDDLTNLFSAIDVTLLFLDCDLHIRRFTPTAAQLFALRHQDIGCALNEVSSPLHEPMLAEEVRRTIATGIPTEREVSLGPSVWYLRRVLPYIVSGRCLGAVITWTDITLAKSLQAELTKIAALEQQRIGQELHDGLQQELTGLGLLAQNLSDILSRKDDPTARQLATRLAQGIAETHRHVRATARGLIPVPVDADSLTPALAELATSTQEQFGIRCTFEPLGSPRVTSAETATHLYRIAQEAVRNAIGHSEADHIRIRLGLRDGALILEIWDNGIGLPRQKPTHRGVGLRLMEHRCALIGGRFATHAPTAGGTLIACTLPTMSLR